MTRRMLINARSSEEVRVAVVDGENLENFQVEVAERGLTRGNIYRGTIANVQPSLNAAFIDYGGDRHGFLAIQDVVPQAYYHQPKGDRAKIEQVLDKGKPIVVQVTREAEGEKGAVLTTDLSLAGRYLVLTPFDSTRGVSRKVEDEDTRKSLRQLAAKLEVPNGCGVILRTNAEDQNKTALSRDLAALLRLWKRIRLEARQGGQNARAKLLYSDQDLIIQALRDHLDSSIEEILVDDDQTHEKAESYLRAFMPRGRATLIRYEDRAPLFSAYKLETQIDRIYDRSVTLPSGGSLVIDRTEALTSIDVNSGRSTRASSQEETALHTNLEAAEEVARQLRLRDVGGLIVVDFIDMRQTKNQRKVEKTLRDAMKPDRARSTVGRLSRNGLLEINRQRVQQALSLRTHRSCPTCGGTGRIPSPEMVGLNLLRRIEARAAMAPLKRVRIALHPELADSIQNTRRRDITALETEFEIAVELIAAPHLHRSEQEVEWFSRDPGELRPPQSKTVQPTASPARPASPKPSRPAPARSAAPARPAAAGEDGEEKKPRRRRRGGRRKPAGAEAEASGNGAGKSEDRDRRSADGKAAADGTARNAMARDDASVDGACRDGAGRDGTGRDATARDPTAPDDGQPKRRTRRRRGGRRRSAAGRAGDGPKEDPSKDAGAES